jgi:hypothetical protein
MDSTNTIHVSFVGGPYDGCISTTQPGNNDLSMQIEMPVSPNVLRLLAGEVAGDEAPIRAVASYRLMLTPNGPRYRFAGFQRVGRRQREELSVWHHALIAAWNSVLGREKP